VHFELAGASFIAVAIILDVNELRNRHRLAFNLDHNYPSSFFDFNGWLETACY
jgi:hypothetical protein